MPNWCNNNLSISGDKKDIFNLFRDVGFRGRNTKQLDNFLGENVINLTSWFPTPKTYLKWDTTNRKRPKKMDESDQQYELYCKGYDNAKKYQKRKYGVVGWYDYNNANLGCKWDVELECIQIAEDKNTITVCFRFDTPWRSPDNWMFKMIKKYNKLYFALEGIEPGVGFIMNVEGENGEITDDSTSDLSDYEEFTNNDLV